MSAADVPMWAALPAALLLVCGGLLTVVGSLGLLRLNAFYARIHAPTMTAISRQNGERRFTRPIDSVNV